MVADDLMNFRYVKMTTRAILTPINICFSINSLLMLPGKPTNASDELDPPFALNL